MKRYLLFLLIFASTIVNAQKFYSSTGGEVILSNAYVDINGKDVTTLNRFTLFYHMESNYNWDFSKYVGIYSGLGIRNIGIIVDEDIKTKYRSYTLGVPLAFKFGNLYNNRFLYAGFEYEMLFHYKEKEFDNGKKSKYTEWFSDRTNFFIPSVFAGYMFKNGLNFRFKMYLDNFFNQNYTETVNNVETKPFQNTTSQIYYFSLSIYIRNIKIKETLEKRDEFFVNL